MDNTRCRVPNHNSSQNRFGLINPHLHSHPPQHEQFECVQAVALSSPHLLPTDSTRCYHLALTCPLHLFVVDVQSGHFLKQNFNQPRLRQRQQMIAGFVHQCVQNTNNMWNRHEFRIYGKGQYIVSQEESGELESS
ncbi:hypothetical protein BLNAU_8591 [Blattamonas nauphoetae]|uniref:Uncharacterized protein n=1 Tax=Blattamonas nauphoetae TaxID=2049346 RepID=A0ABQ9XYH1_9EUKA|nr:hypothetical protein BLNAU_22801 [Blattamonas nauphoetae]KAK2956537.1 hypothetical protein BLNAU_8591 [Blattamonas nauphoetae]